MKGWYQNTAYYTDLNAPVRVAGTDRYPILDGNLVDSGGGNYVFPTGGSNIAPAGFKVVAPPYDPSSDNRAPFPVQWLYVLDDGTVTAPKSGSGTTATVPGATAANPIVGRIAFWTDDETAKVNVNTASEGGYWDTPRVSSKYDYGNLALYPPAKNEFQRYPGHPATTSLSAVFGSLLPVPAVESVTSAAYSSQLKKYYTIAPKVTDGGSQGGTTYAAAAVAPDSDRLYASIDELFFKPDRSRNTDLNATALEQARFFATAHSRSPDLNLFNRPRVAVWPISSTDDDDHRTADDRLIAQAATVNGVPYYFVRSDWKSPNELDLGKNRSLLSYLRALCAKPIPGAQGNGTFATKYNTAGTKGTEIDQILTEIFDYVRCVNVYDTSSGRGSFVPFNNLAPKVSGSGQVIPTYDKTTDTKGFGRFPTIAKAGVLFIAAADPTYQTTTNNALSATPVAAGKVRIQAALVFQLFDPAQGYPGLYPEVTVNVTGSTLGWNYGSGNLFSAGSLKTYPSNSNVARFWGGNLGFRMLRSWPYGSTLNNNYPLISKIESSNPPEVATTGPTGPNTFHFNGGTVNVQLDYTSGTTTTTVQKLVLDFPPGDFPVPTMPTPTTFATSSTGTYNVYDFASRFNQSVAAGSGATIREVMTFTQNDVLRSFQSSTGDYRLSAAIATATGTIDDRLFAKHGDWDNAARWGAHSFKEADGTDYNGAGIGLLTPTATAGYWNSSDIANSTGVQPRRYDNTNKYTSGVTGWTTSVTPDGIPIYLTTGSTAGSTANWTTGNPLGDWDNGTATVMDGAYINLPDEGVGDAPSVNGTVPYYANNANAAAVVGTKFSAPNRLMPSAVMLGSLPTGVFASAAGNLQPWQTLLFHNDPTGKHLGARVAPMDHFLLDLFTMPVVEPYAITDGLSTDGRINMNYQIFPFTYINRDTGIRAVLKTERMLAIANKYSGIGAAGKYDVYKQLDVQSSTRYKNYATADLRYDINADETLKGFQARFAQNDLFRSPSEICTLDLVPNDTAGGASYGTMQAYWEAHALTGDNSREKPYADIYPRLTTRSNTFRVHFRVQALKQAGGANAAPGEWREGVDTVTAEYRGSRVIERYIDPANTAIPDYTDPKTTTPISQFYRFRVLEAKSFPQ